MHRLNPDFFGCNDLKKSCTDFYVGADFHVGASKKKDRVERKDNPSDARRPRSKVLGRRAPVENFPTLSFKNDSARRQSWFVFDVMHLHRLSRREWKLHV